MSNAKKSARFTQKGKVEKAASQAIATKPVSKAEAAQKLGPEFINAYIHSLIVQQIALDFKNWLKLTTCYFPVKTCALISIPREVVRRLKAGENLT